MNWAFKEGGLVRHLIPSTEKFRHLAVSTQVLWFNIQKTHLVKTSQLYKQFKNANPRRKV